VLQSQIKQQVKGEQRASAREVINMWEAGKDKQHQCQQKVMSGGVGGEAISKW